MTNREKLMEELAGLPAEVFYGMMADNHLTIIIDDRQCADCSDINGGCKAHGDEECLITMEAWLGMPCRHAQLISTKGLRRAGE